MSPQSGNGEYSSVNTQLKRRQLMGHLDQVLQIAFEKYENPRTANGPRQGWARVIVNAVSVGDSLLKNSELEALEARLAEVEEVLERELED